MCGDYNFNMRIWRLHWGSPPHVRGLLPLHGVKFSHGRITPACAGTTQDLEASEIEVQDHPRMCGDYTNKIRADHSQQGSPPHVRGLPSFEKTGRKWPRITPACAGTTIPPGGYRHKSWDHPRIGITPACAGTTLKKP